jgi:glutamine cyclotransferase
MNSLRKISFPSLSNFAWIGLLFALMVSCESSADRKSSTASKSPRIRKQVELQSPDLNSTFSLGEPVPFRISRKENLPIDSAFLVVEGTALRLEGDSIAWLGANQVGKPNIRITAYFDSKSESLYPGITFLAPTAPVRYTYQVLGTFPHDEDAFTQGLLFIDEDMYESTGQKGQSSLRQVNYRNGDIEQILNLDPEYFGEGIAHINDEIFQLTWTSQKCLVYDLALNPIREHSFATEGWGITSNKTELIMSDGTEKIYFMNPTDFSPTRTIQAFDHKGKVTSLNELEYINGQIYANIWGEDNIVIIDPNTGAVTGTIDFNGIYDRRANGRFDQAMNGIALSPTGSIFVTGKNWPKLFEIKINKQLNNNPS